MGLFAKKPSEDELAAKEENRNLLEQFKVTDVWGVKRVGSAADVFVYDEDMKAFCIAQNPIDEDGKWKEQNPWVIKFSEVEDVCLFVDEWWSENDDKFEVFHDYHILTIDKYDEVFWKYNLFVRFKTTHPYAKDFEYKMNEYTNVLLIPGTHLIARRGLELNGEYRGADIRAKRIELEEYAEKLKTDLTQEKIFDILSKQRPDSIIGRMKKDLTNDWYVSRVENVAKHVKRAGRISKLINN